MRRGRLALVMAALAVGGLLGGCGRRRTAATASSGGVRQRSVAGTQPAAVSGLVVADGHGWTAQGLDGPIPSARAVPIRRCLRWWTGARSAVDAGFDRPETVGGRAFGVFEFESYGVSAVGQADIGASCRARLITSFGQNCVHHIGRGRSDAFGDAWSHQEAIVAFSRQ
jgi:hypothetical protein